METLKTNIKEAFVHIPIEFYMVFWLSIFFQFFGGVIYELGRIIGYIGFLIISIIVGKYYCTTWAFKIRNYADRKYPDKK